MGKHSPKTNNVYYATVAQISPSPTIVDDVKLPKNKIDYGHFINTYSSRRRPAVTRELTKLHYMAPKGSISLAEGMPNEQTFPFERIAIVLKDGTTFDLNGAELGAALQYIPSQGYPPLLNTLRDFTKYVHEPPNWDFSDVLITNGSQDGISKSLEMIVQEGDPVLVQNPLYAGTETVLKPFKVNLIPIEQDDYGLIPEHLEETLRDLKKKCDRDVGRKMPKILYVNPTAANPTGTTIPLNRRHQIYDLCSRYNIIILEDDAYYFMHFMDDVTPSFLSLDVDGRVLRFDSLSKILSSGLRIGWVTGPKQLINNLELHVQSSYLHSSTLSQVITNNLLQTWGYERLMAHFASIREFYKKRRDITLAAMERHLDGLCDWSVPTGGMFVWIRVRDINDVYEMLITRGIQKLITFVPGHAFMADSTKPCNLIRASYSKATPQQIDVAMKRLAELIREEKLLLKRKIEQYS